jgi:hypothetical protein
MKTTKTAVILAAFVLTWGSSCAKKKKADADADAMKSAALMALKMNPAVEILKTDDAKGMVTYRDKGSGEEVTLSFDDLAQGRFNIKVKDAKGRETSVGASQDGSGGMTITGPDGKMTLGGDAAGSAPPAWVPPYPGAKAAPGAMRMEKDDSVNGSYVMETADSVAKVKEFYDTKLKGQGFKTEAMSLNIDGKDNASVSAEKSEAKQKLTVSISSEGGKTTVMLIYEGPKK